MVDKETATTNLPSCVLCESMAFDWNLYGNKRSDYRIIVYYIEIIMLHTYSFIFYTILP